MEKYFHDYLDLDQLLSALIFDVIIAFDIVVIPLRIRASLFVIRIMDYYSLLNYVRLIARYIFGTFKHYFYLCRNLKISRLLTLKSAWFSNIHTSRSRIFAGITLK